MATREELAQAYEEAQPPDIPRIRVYGGALPPENDTPWGKPAEQGGRPQGRLFEPDLSPALGSVVRPPDQNLINQYMTTVQEPGQPDRQVFELPQGRQQRANYGRGGALGIYDRLAGANDVAPPVAWDPDRPRPELAQPPQPSRLDRALDYGAAPARMVAGMFTPPQSPAEQRPVTGGLPPSQSSLANDEAYRRAQYKFGFDTALNMIGAGRLPGAAPPGAVGAGGGQRPTTFYRGVNPGDERRIATGNQTWDQHLFAADNPDAASMYGKTLTRLEASPDARILYEGTEEWRRVAGQWRKGESLLDYSTRAADAAKAAGYDAAYFKRQGDVGTAIFNPAKFTQAPFGAEAPRAPLPMDEASRLARAKEQGYTIDAYHGTSAPEFDRFDPSKVRDNIQYGGNFYFSPNPEFASKASTSWGGEHPRVMPVKLKAENPFRMDQPVTNEQAANVLQALGGREEQVKAILEGGPLKHWTGSTLFYHAMGQNVSAVEKANAIRKAGYDAIIGDPGREIAGKPGKEHIMVFDPDQIRSRYAAFDPASKGSGFILGAGANDPKSVGLGTILNATRNPEPIRAYHSSPHDFDKFDISKIGTGEGAQVYGHGLYFAENPKVSGQGGEYWNQFKNRFAYNPAEMEAINILQNHNFDRKAAVAELERLKTYHPGYLEGATNNYDRLRRSEIIAKTEGALDILKSDKPIIGPRTYEVNINARPEQMLDWDQPIGGQQAYKMLQEHWDRKIGDPDIVVERMGISSESPGGRLHSGIGGMTQNKVGTAEMLREAGIPGIRYADQGSRGVSDVAERTHNYVIFDPGIVDIMKKYGVVGAPTAGALGSVVNPQEYRQ